MVLDGSRHAQWYVPARMLYKNVCVMQASWRMQGTETMGGLMMLFTDVMGRTALMAPSCPLNLRIIFPVPTSHKNSCRSPPHEAILYGGRTSFQESVHSRSRSCGLVAVGLYLLLSEETATSRTS